MNKQNEQKTEQTYEFYTKLARILNSGVSRSVVLSGNIYDLFWNSKDYVPLIGFLLEKTASSQMIQIVYEANTPIKIFKKDRETLKNWWATWKMRMTEDYLTEEDKQKFLETYRKQFDEYFDNAIGSHAAALELMRQLCCCSRSINKQPLLIFIGGADMILPADEISKLSDSKLKCISIVQNWFGDPSFVNGKDSVCLISESKNQINDKISRMPQIISVDINSPNVDNRIHYINEFLRQKEKEWPVGKFKNIESFASAAAGLSIYALRQMLMTALYAKEPITLDNVTEKVEQYIQSQLGDGVIEFKKPTHRLKDIVGNTKLKKFVYDVIIPRVVKGGDGAISGCAVSGGIGGGKTFTFEAVSAELERPVMVLKNLRSQWFGQTDVIFERLRRVIFAIGNLCIFVDEADTSMGGVGPDVHETERRLTGKIQELMSDSELKGKVFWILMTARINLLSPDVRRPGRAGDLIIPVLDPEGEDRMSFISWALSDLADASLLKHLNETLPKDYSAASFTALRSHLKASSTKNMNYDDILALINDLIPTDIGLTREYQTLQALVNCTRRSLLPELTKSLEESRMDWQKRIAELQAIGIK